MIEGIICKWCHVDTSECLCTGLSPERETVVTMVLLMERGATQMAYARLRDYVTRNLSGETWERLRPYFDWRGPCGSAYWYNTSLAGVIEVLSTRAPE